MVLEPQDCVRILAGPLQVTFTKVQLTRTKQKRIHCSRRNPEQVSRETRPFPGEPRGGVRDGLPLFKEVRVLPSWLSASSDRNHLRFLIPSCHCKFSSQKEPFSQGGSGTEPEPETGTVGTVFSRNRFKAEPEPPEPFSRHRNRNRNRPFLLKCTETQKTLFAEEPPEPKTGTA